MSPTEHALCMPPPHSCPFLPFFPLRVLASLYFPACIPCIKKQASSVTVCSGLDSVQDAFVCKWCCCKELEGLCTPLLIRGHMQIQEPSLWCNVASTGTNCTGLPALLVPAHPSLAPGGRYPPQLERRCAFIARGKPCLSNLGCTCADTSTTWGPLWVFFWLPRLVATAHGSADWLYTCETLARGSRAPQTKWPSTPA